MGGPLGLVSGGLLGFAAGKYRQHQEQEQQFQQTQLKGFHDDADPSQPGYDPSTVANPKWRQAVTKAFGDKQAADAFLMQADVHAASYQQHQANIQKQLAPIMQLITGGGATPPTAPTGPTSGGVSFTDPSGTSPSGQGQPAAPATAPTTGAAAAAPPTTPAPADDIDAHLQKLAAAKALAAGLPPEYAKSMNSAIDATIKTLEEKRKEGAAKERQQAGFDQQEKMLGERKKVEEGLIGERAKVEEKLIGEREQASKDLEKYRTDLKTTLASKADKPWTPKDSLAARKSTLDQAKAELVTTGWFGSVRQASGDKVNQRAAEIRLSEGLDPTTANRLKDGDTVRMPDGKTYVWRDTK